MTDATTSDARLLKSGRAWRKAFDDMHERAMRAEQELVSLRASIRNEIINTPETADFMAGVPLEAAHQRERWGAEHDAGKMPEDWLFLVGHLASKACAAVRTGNTDKALHHTISTAAALSNWHAALTGASTEMRPGIDPAEKGIA